LPKLKQYHCYSLLALKPPTTSMHWSNVCSKHSKTCGCWGCRKAQILHEVIWHSLAMHATKMHSPSRDRHAQSICFQGCVRSAGLGCLQSKCLEGARFAPTVLAVREFAEVLSLIVTNIQDTTAPPPPKTPPNPTAYPESLDPPSRKSPRLEPRQQTTTLCYLFLSSAPGVRWPCEPCKPP
jgi:hypothetical protein